MKISPKRVFVMISGGVDSSVAAFLLAKNKNYEVIGCFIKGYNIDGCQEADAEDARRVAGFLKIPFYVIDLEKEYKKLVVDYMINGYKKGITPNPDVMCNKEIKFGLFLEKALGMGADYVATGHYARLSRIAFRKQHNFLPARKFASLSPRHSSLRSETKLAGLRDVPQDNPASPLFSLYQAKDENKDQSYFLWTLTQKQLKHCLFPIGDYLKSEVREIAKKAGLPTAEKKDSQGICFLGMVKFKDFLKQYLPIKKGDVLLASSSLILRAEGLSGAKGPVLSKAKGTVYKKIGEHEGVWFYTIGQRRIGIMNYKSEISGRRETKPLYVIKKDIKKNILTVAEGEDNAVLYKKEIELTDINFLNPLILNTKHSIPIMARVRYRQPLVEAKLICRKSSIVGCKLFFEQPQKFVAPGQSAVFYLPAEAQKAKAGDKNGEMLGGGIII